MYRIFPCIKGGGGKKKVKVVENWIFENQLDQRSLEMSKTMPVY
jgi:hypothetical protein